MISILWTLPALYGGWILAGIVTSGVRRELRHQVADLERDNARLRQLADAEEGTS